MAGVQIDGVNNKIDFDDDLDTSISANTDDTLVIEAGGVNIASITAGEFAINEGSADIDFRVESNGNANMLVVDGGDDDVRIGTATTFGNNDAGLKVKGGITIGDFTADSAANNLMFVKSRNTTVGSQTIVADDDEIGRIAFKADDGDDTSYNNNVAAIFAQIDGTPGTNDTPGRLMFETTPDGARVGTEKMRLTSAGRLLVGKTSTADATVGCEMRENGQGTFTRSGGPGINVTRNTNDGDLIKFIQDASLEGTISVSGTTVSYNGFTGSHWSRLADNSRPTILRGTIIDSIDEMCDWYQAVADVAEVKYTAEDSEVIDGDKNVGDVKTEAHKIIEEIALPSDKSVGDAVTFTSNGVEYTGKYVKEGDVKHVKSKVSDTADSTKIYGIFSHWDEEGADTVNDMFVSQVGTYVVRVHKDVTVAAGDLLVSNGDGTAKVQDDDIIRSKTVAKVNSNIKVETYSDGSYTVPCTLHC